MRYYNIKLNRNDDFTTPVDETMFLAIYHQGLIDHYDEVQVTAGTYKIRLRAAEAYEAAQEAQIELAYRRRAQIIRRLNEESKVKHE